MDPLVTNQTCDKPSCSTTLEGDTHDGKPPDNNATLVEDACLAARLAREDNQYYDDVDCASDSALAAMLQRQFDIEYDNKLKKQEARLNGHSKVGISLENFKRVPDSKSSYEMLNSDNYSDSRDAFYESDCKLETDLTAWDVFEQSDMKRRPIGRTGFFVDEEGNLITKHDIPTSGRRNMCRLMELKTDIQTGDAGAFKDDFKINNSVYNRLKVHSKKSTRRASQRAFDKKERQNDAILQDIQSVKMSDATRAIMDGLLIAYKIEKLNGIIGHGKESTVLHATGRDHENNPGQEVAIKIFKSDQTMAFKTRDTYNKSRCPSYKFDKPKSKVDSLYKWAERGFKNLKLMRKAGINCPNAISLRKHVLIMTFLGNNAKPSPQLKEAHLDNNQLKQSYNQVIDIMVKMYKDCELIHGDLSEYNLLWHNDRVFVIDVSQSMFTSHPNANSFLFRDCKNVLDFYRKSGLEEILSPKDLFRLICGKDLEEKDIELWTKIEDFPRNEKLQQKDENGRKQSQRSDDFEQMLRSTQTVSTETTDNL